VENQGVGLDPVDIPRRGLDWLAGTVAAVGKAVAWLTLLMVLLTFVTVVLRYGFNLGWIWLQESITYLHAMVFMLAAAWALQTNDHVRVDIFYHAWTARKKALVDLLGTLLFLVPVCVFLLLISWNYVATSWAVQEGSRSSGGLPFLYVQKTLILLLPVLLLLQALVTIRNSVQTLRRSAEPDILS
jgi:TRAP-type mannitol/chloroaromatic compound transport system permease small subunit